jgi:hypothetical protein
VLGRIPRRMGEESHSLRAAEHPPTYSAATSASGLGPRIIAIAARLWVPRMRVRTLLVAGLLAALIGGGYLWHHLPAASSWEIQGHRLTSLEGSIRVIGDGGPPLLAESPTSTPEHPKYDHVLAEGDNPGTFIYVPLIATLLGVGPLVALKLLMFVLFLVPIAYYPLVFYRLTGSALAAAAAPALLVTAVVRHSMFIDLYWILGWAALALLPLILLAWRMRGRSGLVLLVGTMLAASFATSIRGGAGTGLLVASIGVVLFGFKPWSKRLRAASAVLLVGAYLVFTPGITGAIDRYSTDWAGSNLVTAEPDTTNPFHSAYIGLGYQPNPWGIYWLDQIAYRDAQRANPGVPYLGPGYNDTLRDLFFDRIKEDPGYFAGLVLKKLAVSLLIVGAGILLFILLTAVALLLVGPARRLMQTAILIAIPALLMGIAPGLLGIPVAQYIFGSTGTFDFLEIVEWSILLAMLGAWLGPKLLTQLAAPGFRSRGDIAIVGVLVAAVLVYKAGLPPARSAIVTAILAFSALVIVSGIRGRLRNVSYPRAAQQAALAVVVLVVLVQLTKHEASGVEERYAEWEAQAPAVGTKPSNSPTLLKPPN